MKPVLQTAPIDPTHSTKKARGGLLLWIPGRLILPFCKRKRIEERFISRHPHELSISRGWIPSSYKFSGSCNAAFLFSSLSSSLPGSEDNCVSSCVCVCVCVCVCTCVFHVWESIMSKSYDIQPSTAQQLLMPQQNQLILFCSGRAHFENDKNLYETSSLHNKEIRQFEVNECFAITIMFSC